MGDDIRIFDRQVVRLHRDRAARDLARHDFLFRETADRLVERLDDVRRRFPVALDLGCHGGEVGRALNGRGGVETLVQADLSPAMTRLADGRRVACDEEFLPFAPASFDLVLSNLSLHWVNDLPGALVQIRRALKPDGLLLATMLGGETLKELRHAWMEAELAEEGGAGPRVSPFADIRDAGGLLQRAGFALPVADADTITVSYPDAMRLIVDLRGMGETNAVADRRKGLTRRATLFHAVAAYQRAFEDDKGRVPATFQTVTLTAWAPHEAQPRPLRPGGASIRLSDALNGQPRPVDDLPP
ncbi:MAG: methyltransferase domain-containing protein [Alphaproteobacteria bacterium]|nr:methyltransferase domain-containing protein [Alphaproteobacteria bacterium]